MARSWQEFKNKDATPETYFDSRNFGLEVKIRPHAFSLNFAIAFPILEVPEGYWGRFEYPQTVGMAIVAGAFWGGFWGLVAGAVALPVISLVMGF